MTHYNPAIRDKNLVDDIETEAGISLGRLAEINGSSCMDFLIKATKVWRPASGTGSFGFKALYTY